MSTSRNKFVLLLLLVLLQCFAPLLHAHTHGLSVASGVHIDGVDELLSASSGIPAFKAERNDGPAIAMEQEYRRVRADALHDANQPVLPTSAILFASVFLRLPFLAVSFVTRPPRGPQIYSLPFSQAPPLKLI